MLTPLLGSLHWLPLTTRRGFRCLCVGGGLSQPSSCSPAPSLTPRIRKAWALLPQQTTVPSQWLIPVSLFLLMPCPHCESAGGFIHHGLGLKKAFSWCISLLTVSAGWRGGSRSFTGSQSIHLEVTHCTPAHGSLARASHVALPDFKAL